MKGEMVRVVTTHISPPLRPKKGSFKAFKVETGKWAYAPFSVLFVV
jgi:hypothetical protein